MGETLESIWKKRASAFYRDSMPYVGYMLRSGVPLVLFLVLIVSAVYYTEFIKQVPADFPVIAAGAVLLTPLVAWSPLRTWLQPADLVFLMPREAHMGAYIRRSFRHNLPGGLALAAIVLLLFWPILAGAAESSGAWKPGLWITLAAVLAMKAANSAAAWRERQAAWPSARWALRLLRWFLTAWAAAAWLAFLPWKAAAFTAVSGALWWAASRLAARQSLPWETLIREEGRTQMRYYRFFGWFTDVPALGSAVSSRPYLSWLSKLVPLRRQSAYTYLYSLSMARTELGGMLLRLTLLGMLSCYWLGEAAWLGGWGTAAAQLLFLLIAGLQTSSLGSWHQYTVWRHVYPLPEKERLKSLIQVDRLALLIVLLLLWLAGSLPLLLQGKPLPAAAAAAAGAGYILLLRPRRLTKRVLADEDED
ncbi:MULTISPECIES: ABC transporter permease [unclassified Paenibacillus]|uniref:ABC transporter permease n=1 Tax=unclassified Paenibacillus TaxID=185978 RepID=UPI000955B557|nr:MULTISPECIES: ABC transporter permease [unclassified Paenibacillus]ASS68958.1 ABC transporter permease [Paenibacillus sp. RUD330]SIR13237.1 ABC-2 type transport system permease protein [Paenibacillus sp. RU4X]SIR24310.1 ABC-2 type transport system permease protein [Paenibacillus sp. RU4T]